MPRLSCMTRCQSAMGPTIPHPDASAHVVDGDIDWSESGFRCGKHMAGGIIFREVRSNPKCTVMVLSIIRRRPRDPTHLGTGLQKRPGRGGADSPARAGHQDMTLREIKRNIRHLASFGNLRLQIVRPWHRRV